MIEIKSLCHSFGDKVIFENFDLILPDKGIVSIMGESGCGKTTLLNIIAGIIKPNSGSVKFSPADLTVSYMFQESRLLPWATVWENVDLSLGGKMNSKEEAKEILFKLGLEDASNKYPEELSGGMKQRVSLARALAHRGDILLLDEPFNGLDEGRIKSVIEIINDYASSHLVLLVTHQKEYAAAISDKTYLL